MWSPAEVKDAGRVKHPFKLKQGLFTMDHFTDGEPQPIDPLYGKAQLLCLLQMNHKVVQVETQGHSSHWLPWPATFLWEHVLPSARKHQGICDNGDAKTLQQLSPSNTPWTLCFQWALWLRVPQGAEGFYSLMSHWHFVSKRNRKSLYSKCKPNCSQFFWSESNKWE